MAQSPMPSERGEPTLATTIGHREPIRTRKRLPPGVVLWHPLDTLGGVRLYPGRFFGVRNGLKFMQFSSRYDGRRLPARPPFSLARSFKSLVDWFDYAYAVVPAAAVWARNPSFRPRGKHSPAVIHLPGPFWRDALHVAQAPGNAPRPAVQRSLAKFALFAALLGGIYFAFAVTTGGPGRVSAPTNETPALAAFSVHPGADGEIEKLAQVIAPPDDQPVTVATPVRTLQSALGLQSAPAVAAAESSSDAVKPIAAPSVAPAAPVAATAVERPAAAAPAATQAPAPATAAAPSAGPNYPSAIEIRAFAATAGWSAEHLDDVVTVAWCESTNNSAAVGGLGARGLMQVMPFWFGVAGVDFAHWADPVTNLKVALVVYQTRIAELRDPWSAWDCQPGRSS